jgi:hypothetical protein
LIRAKPASRAGEASSSEVAAHVHVHPHTVRHRPRQLTGLFGDQIHDLGLRFELKIALRADCARGRGAGRTAARSPR